jgi:hypothetical protein
MGIPRGSTWELLAFRQQFPVWKKSTFNQDEVGLEFKL